MIRKTSVCYGLHFLVAFLVAYTKADLEEAAVDVAINLVKEGVKQGKDICLIKNCGEKFFDLNRQSSKFNRETVFIKLEATLKYR